MVDAAQIQEHAEVLGSDGTHVGTVDHIDKGEIKLTKTDAAAGGLHHYIPLDFVRSVEGGKVHLDRPAEEVKLLRSVITLVSDPQVMMPTLVPEPVEIELAS